jgi:hypothetical protein
VWLPAPNRKGSLPPQGDAAHTLRWAHLGSGEAGQIHALYLDQHRACSDHGVIAAEQACPRITHPPRRQSRDAKPSAAAASYPTPATPPSG